MTRGGKIPHLVIMVGDNVGECKTVESNTQESSPEVLPVCVGRKCTMIPSGGKRQVQPLISDVAKKMRMSSNLAKMKKEVDELAHPEDDWDDEVYSNSITIVCFDQYSRGEFATFCKLPISKVNHGQTTASNSNILSRVNESCFDDIPGTTEIIQAEEELDFLTNVVENSGTSEIVGKDSNLHSADSSAPAAPLALEYVDTEVPQNCNKQEIVLACTDYPFIFKASGKSEEESEEAIRKNTLAEEFKERPEVKRCKMDVSPTVGTFGTLLCNLTLPLPTNIFSMFRVQSGSSHSISILGENQRGKKGQRRKIPLQ